MASLLNQEGDEMQVINHGGGIGQDKHIKLQKYLEQWNIVLKDAVLIRFEAKEYYQTLLHVFRDRDNQYYLVTSSVDYNKYLNYLDWKNGILLLEGDEKVEYEGEIMTFHLPIDAIQILSGDAIGWILDKNRKLKIKYEPDPDEEWNDWS